MFVITADQRGSRSQPDRVDAALRLVGAAPLVRPFERTAGDELQGVADDPAAALGVVLLLVRDGHWSVGVGVGGVRTPLPEQTRAGAGEAFERARVAVTRAKARPDHVALDAAGADAEDADALLSVHAAIVARRSAAGWEAVDMVESGLTQSEVAERLGISKQAVSQRLRAAWWPQQAGTTPLLVRLLRALDDGELP